MSNFLLNVLKGGRNELRRLTDDDTGLAVVGGAGGFICVGIVLLIAIFYNSKKSDFNMPLIMLFYISLYIIVVSLGIGLFNIPLKTERDTNLFTGDLQLIFRVIVIPILIIISLIWAQIPRDKGGGYFEYMITHLLQTENVETNLKKVGLLALPLAYGLIEVATNGGNFTSLSTYYSSIASIIGMVIVGGMQLFGKLSEKVFKTGEKITNNLDKKQSNIVAEVIVLFTTIITILTNMTQRVEGLIFSSVILLLMLIGVLVVSTPKNMIGVRGGIGLIACVIIVQIILHFTMFKQENTIDINDITTLENELTPIQKESVTLKGTINDPESLITINKMKDAINKNEKYSTTDINTIFGNYETLTIKSQEYMDKLVEIIKKIKQNKSLTKDDREEKIYEDKLNNYKVLLENNKIEERAILQEFVNITVDMDNLMDSFNRYIDTIPEVQTALKAKNEAQTTLDTIKKDNTATIIQLNDATTVLNTATSAYNNLVSPKYQGTDYNISKEEYTTKKTRLKDLDTIYTNLDTDSIKKDNDILNEQKANIDLLLYFVSIGGFILGIKNIR